ncbi:MAG: DegT/DnrJ/EryC1/StrS family aminotransferase [Spartobacteria bacterium]|nr:DegT/DnrJ/EryC1/StrS family aminotransferase [Spartobacteria bacterium]
MKNSPTKDIGHAPIYVTRPSLAQLDEFIPYLESIWNSGVMTHNGPLMQKLEREISAYLEIPDTVCLSNGTCALQLAIRALDLKGEIITTPFTFVATSSIIAWERCSPVFVDIEPSTWNMDPAKIEAAITNKTVAILPVHVFSAPCDVEAIQTIADKHGLKVIYDAAHAMAVQLNGKSIMGYGDVSCTSFHATKLFNTCEGGACFAKDPAIAARIRRMRFFGFDEQKDIVDEGMNAKMTEMAAALGLANLPHLDQVRVERRRQSELYQSLLGSDSSIQFQQYDPESYNYSYMPVLFETEMQMLRVLERLKAQKVFARRYFYPSLHTVQQYKADTLPVAESIASRIACLPIYSGLPDEDVERICGIVLGG